GDFETAAGLFRRAEERKADLTPSECEELARLRRDNSLALKARRDGGDQLRLAEKAALEGRTADANALLKKVAVNHQFLSGHDNRRFLSVSEQLRPRPVQAGAAPAVAPPGVSPTILAHTKVRQGRALLAQGNFEGAEAAAREAEKLNVRFAATEDSPRRLLEDIGKARNDPKALLQAARTSLQHNDLGRAEYYAHLAEKQSSIWTFPVCADHPSQ